MISIIVPTYNREEFLEKTLESYIHQKYVDEILIINDGSTDSTDKVLEDLRRKYVIIKIVKHDINKGLAASRIDGILESKNDLILFGEDDVIFEKDYVEKLFNCLQQHNAGIVGGRVISKLENETNEEALTRWNNLGLPLIDFRYFEGNFGVKTDKDVEVPFLHAIYLANKKVFKNVKLETYYKGNEYREETDLQISVLKEGFKIVFCPGAICYHLAKLIKNKGGGVHTMNKISYEYWTIKNNNLFLKRHHEFLRRSWIRKSRMIMAVDFAINRIFYYLIYRNIGRWCRNIWKKFSHRS